MKLILSVILLSLLSGCNAQKKELCLENLEKKLTPTINKTIKQFEIINIKDSISCFEWDSLLIESGYATKETIRKYYGIELQYNFNNSNLDSDVLIFFIKNNKIINHVVFSTTCRITEICKSYDFTHLIKYTPEALIPKEDAVFEVYTKEVKDNQGNSWKVENAIRLKK